jgi:ATP-dependent Clp endopeptidase proteolytic subunit ClpP
MAHNIRSESEPATIYIYDSIAKNNYWEDSVSAKAIIEALESIDAREITVRINSPGGDVFEGDAIYNALRRRSTRSKIHVAIDGLAASAAAYVAMAGDEIEIAANAFLMIHESWSYAVGNKRDFDKSREMLAKIDVSIAQMMATRSGQSSEDVTKWMEAETWFSASEAVEKKFADKIGTELNSPVSDAVARAAGQWAKIPTAFQQSLAAYSKRIREQDAQSKTPRLDALKRRMGHA